MQRSALCRSRRELSNAYFLAKIGFDTAENEPSKIWPIAAGANETAARSVGPGGATLTTTSPARARAWKFKSLSDLPFCLFLLRFCFFHARHVSTIHQADRYCNVAKWQLLRCFHKHGAMFLLSAGKTVLEQIFFFNVFSFCFSLCVKPFLLSLFMI